MTRTKKVEAKEIEVALRQSQAIEYRKAGYSYRAIGAKLNISHEQARRDIENEMDVRMTRRAP